MPLALLALAIGAFGIGTTEFVIMGLLPEVAADYGTSIPTAGFLVTGYALGVVLGAPLMTVLGTRIPRKRMLMLLMGLFIAGNVLSALAPAFGVMLAGRVDRAISERRRLWIRYYSPARDEVTEREIDPILGTGTLLYGIALGGIAAL
ncbi:MFS transporter, partial [Streptomyces vinaceus]|uniref:MFS transporter n=1 Tax=Streptomyces vinaceus TaxID=1960 RepID=UPI0035D877AD